jgi:hypothetical protein
MFCAAMKPFLGFLNRSHLKRVGLALLCCLGGLVGTEAQPLNLVGAPGADGSRIYAYLYVTPSEVRCELLMPLATLERWVAVPRADAGMLTVAEQEAAQPLIDNYFKQVNPVDIDGLRVTPVLARCDFGVVDARDPGETRVLAPVATDGAWAGIILSFNTAGAPVNLRLKWTMFDEQVQSVTAQVYAFDQQLQKHFQPGDSVYEWSGLRRKAPKLSELRPEPTRLRYRLPLLSAIALVMAGVVAWRGLRQDRANTAWRRHAGLWCLSALVLLPAFPVRMPAFVALYPSISSDEAGEVFATLHKNIYRAFDYRTESDIYDALARSVSGDLLRTLYRDIRKDLEFEGQGRAVSRVSDVRIESGALAAPPPGMKSNSMRAFCYDAVWTLSGVVGHWGHSHERTNRYHAVFTVEVIDGAWKITKIEILKEEQLEIRFLN